MDEKIGKNAIEKSLEIFTGKWKVIILFQIFQYETLRFSELQRLIPSITKKMLSGQLRDLEKNGILKRGVFPEIPPKVEYSVTAHGKTLTPLLSEMHRWGSEHIDYIEEGNPLN